MGRKQAVKPGWLEWERSQPEKPDGLKVEIITDFEELLGMEEEWNRFANQTDADSPFTSHEWVTSWWQCFGRGKDLHIVIAREGNRIKGIAPLMSSRECRYGLPVQRLGSLYNGQVQRDEFIVDDRYKSSFCKVLWKHLMNHGDSWDLLELCQFDYRSATLQELEKRATGTGVVCHYWTQGHSPYLPLTGAWEGYISGLSANRRSQIRRKLRRLAERGEVELKKITSEDEIASALEDGFRIEGMAWKEVNGTAILSDEQVYRFYVELAERMAARGSLGLYFLQVGERKIAFQYCLESKNRIYLLKPGYNPEFFRYSPSTLLFWLILKQAFEDGVTEYDFLGDRDDWKMTWTNKTRTRVWFFLLSTSFRARVLRLVKFWLIPKVKSISGLAD
ncbi:MAG: GNAT family N-acetyltransferase [Pseudohongiellaceae bacterium]